MSKIVCVLYDDPVTGYPKKYARDDLPRLTHYPGGQTMPSPQAIDFKPGALLGSVSGELGLRKFLESRGHKLVVTSDKDGPNSRLAKELADAEILISQPFWPAYATAELIAKAPKLKLIVTAGIGSDHTDLQAAMNRGITVAEVTYCNSISVSEHVVMMILSLVRNYIPSHDWVVKGGWNIADCVERSYDVEGMNVGTVASGRIGLAVLRRMKPFDVKLHYTDRHRLPESVEQELGAHVPPERRVDGPGLRRRHDQLPAAPGNGGHVQRRADREDEARRLHREHGARQDLRSRRDRPGAEERAARRLRGRRLVPAAAAAQPSVAHDAARGHDAAHLGFLAVRAGALCGGDARDPGVLLRQAADPQRVPDRGPRPACRDGQALVQRGQCDAGLGRGGQVQGGCREEIRGQESREEEEVEAEGTEEEVIDRRRASGRH